MSGSVLALGSVGALALAAELQERPPGEGSLSRVRVGAGLVLLVGAGVMAWQGGLLPFARAETVSGPKRAARGAPAPEPAAVAPPPVTAARPGGRCTHDGVYPKKIVQRRNDGRNYPSSVPNIGSWKGRLGTEISGGINFHCLLDGRNNYRGAIDIGEAGRKECKKSTRISKEFFEELRREYGIERILTLNAECGGKEVPAIAQSAGLEVLYRPQGGGGPSRKGFEEMKAFLRKGNVLIHCRHGADRTGAIVGRYYVEDGILPLDVAVEHTKQFGGHKYEDAQNFLLNGPSR